MADRVLIVDDEDAILRLVARIVQSDTRSVDTATCAEEALPRIDDGVYDLYILDKNLPGMNGIDLAARVRAVDRAAAILILTGFASREGALDALHVGVDGYVEKPVKREALLQRVESGLEAAHNRRNLSDRLRTARAAARSALDQLGRPADLTTVLAHPDKKIAAQLAAHLGGAVETVTDLAALETRLGGARPDLLLVDTALADDLTPILRQARELHPQVAIVVTGPTPSLQGVQALIFSGVRAVVEEPLSSNGALNDRLTRVLARLGRS